MKKLLFLLTFGCALSLFACNSAKKTTEQNRETTSKQRPQRGERPQNGERPQRGERPNAAQLIGTMDKNGDGMLSKEEVQGPLANDFGRVDANSDGFITKEELENAPRPQRGERPRN